MESKFSAVFSKSHDVLSTCLSSASDLNTSAKRATLVEKRTPNLSIGYRFKISYSENRLPSSFAWCIDSLIMKFIIPVQTMEAQILEQLRLISL